MPVALHHIVIDAHDLPALARFWAEALRWRILSEREREVVIGPDENAPVGICFMPTPDGKVVKNRLHLDLTSDAEDRDAEINRLLALGARRAEVGQRLARAARHPSTCARIHASTSPTCAAAAALAASGSRAVNARWMRACSRRVRSKAPSSW